MRFGTYYHGLHGLLLLIKNEFYEIRGRLFDSWNGVETCGQIPVDELGIPDKFKVHAVKYQPTKIGVFLHAMNSLPARNWADFAFVDYGCGKGTCLLLATQFQFDRIVGIELSESLASIARRNSKRFKGGRHNSRMHIQCCSSVEAKLPRQPSVYFFYNPFDEHVMADTMRCIDGLLAEINCEAYALYINPRHKDVLAANGFRLIGSGKCSGEDWTLWHRPARDEMS